MAARLHAALQTGKSCLGESIGACVGEHQARFPVNIDQARVPVNVALPSKCLAVPLIRSASTVAVNLKFIRVGFVILADQLSWLPSTLPSLIAA